MKNTVATIQQQKENNDKITMLTAYDYSMAKLMDESGINMLLVGDSLGMVMPVSYTHLDVYKRQPLLWGSGCG